MVSHSTLLQFLDPLDWFIFFAVLAATFASVAWGQRLKLQLSPKEQLSTIELLLMGRRLTLPLFVATLVATWYGGIFGVTTLTFEKGVYNFVTQGVFWYVSYLIFAIFLVKRIRRHNVLTIAELAGKVIGPKAEKLTAGLNFLNLLPLAYTISLGLFLQALFGGTLFVNTAIGVAVVTVYSLWGGFRAVVFSDLVQFVFMILAVLLIVVFAWAQMGSPLTLMDKLPASHFDWTGGEKPASLLVWGFIALSTLVDPNFYQKCLAAKDEAVARRGIFISTVVWFFFDCCTTLGALYARAALPDANPQNAYLQFAMQLVPHGVRGLILAGILATILSTLDAYLFNAATCISYDMTRSKERFKPLHHHLALVFVSVISIFLGIHFDGNVVDVWKTLGSFSAACLLFPLLVAQWLPGRIPERNFCWAVSIGCIGIVSWRILNKIYQFSDVDEFYIGLLLTTVPLLPSIILKKA
ncbi:MAG TPA: sodium:solute symporter family protein [Bacteriovoracaceae bacterium]|nr:sodium:solute symporter family protein [Bacteriovoracaceae bacterium]